MSSLVTSLRWLTLLSVLFWFIGYWQGGRKVVADIQSSIKIGSSRLDTLLIVAIGIASFVVAITGLLMALEQLPTDPQTHEAITLLGSGWVGLGILGMFYSRHYLGRFWTAETTLMPDHQLVDQGPYRIVRHPIYTFAISMYAGLGLVFPAWWNALSVSIIVIAYALKAWEEDRFLEQSLPGYTEYRQRVRYRLVPGLW